MRRLGNAETGEDASVFAIKDCALAAIATGRGAQNLKELRDELLTIDPASVYYHFWGGLLRPTFDDPRYNNDFARWVHSALHNSGLAERLSVIDPCDFGDLEGLRREVVEVIEQELESIEILPWTPRERQFHFIRSQIVVFGTDVVVRRPEGLADAVEAASLGSIFYHFVDARRRTPDGIDDFRAWLSDLGDGYPELRARLAGIDPFFQTLTELRAELARAIRESIGGGDA